MDGVGRSIHITATLWKITFVREGGFALVKMEGLSTFAQNFRLMRKSDNERNRRPSHKKGNSKNGTPPKGSFAEKANRFAAQKKSSKPKPNSNPDLIRLNKYIANAGICSRREADTFIAAGNVTVNGKPVTEMGYKVKKTDDVRFDGRKLNPEKKEYVLLNKPKNFITTTRDEKGRRTVMELISSASNNRLYPVGRLDRNTTGLLLFTNDGDLAKKLTHPKHGVRKIYHVHLDKNVALADLRKIREGLELEDGKIEVDEVDYVSGATKKEVGMEIHSGKNRIVRRIFEHLGYEVSKLDRVVFAGLTKKDLPRGHWRFLTEQEVINLGMIK